MPYTPHLPVRRLRRQDRAEQGCGVGVPRSVGELLGVTDLHGLPGVHHCDAVVDAAQHRQVVGDEHDAGHDLLVQHVQQHVAERLLRGHIQRRRGLVGNQEPRVEQSRDGRHRPLLHAARQLVRIRVEHACRQIEALQPVPGPVQGLVPLDRPVVRSHHVEDQVADPHGRADGVHRALGQERHHGAGRARSQWTCQRACRKGRRRWRSGAIPWRRSRRPP